MYDMTMKELLNTLQKRASGLSYRLWKQALLNGAVLSKDFPKTHQKANPELDLKPKVTIKMPDFLKEQQAKRR